MYRLCDRDTHLPIGGCAILDAGSGLLTKRTQVRTVVNLSSYAELAVRLANTAVRPPGEPDPLGSTEACASALSECLEGPVTRRDLDVLRHLRAELIALFTAAATGDDKTAMGKLNGLLVQFPIQPEMVCHDDRWHIHLAAQGSAADRFAAGAIIGVGLRVSQVGVSRLGICAIASCHRVFIDASRGRSRRYCAEHTAARGNVSPLRGETAGQRSQVTPAAS
jgi:predicted RNA-binding Zn ribbon-like protein